MKKQLELAIPNTHGGWRKGAGRKPKGRGCVSHDLRPFHDESVPVHVTLRVREDVPSLRRPDTFPIVMEAIAKASKAGYSIVHFSAQSNHLHLYIEAKDRSALSKGMQGLAIRIAGA